MIELVGWEKVGPLLVTATGLAWEGLKAMAGHQNSSPGTFQLILRLIKAEVPLPRLAAADGGLAMYLGYLPCAAAELGSQEGTYGGRTRVGDFLQGP